MRNLYKILVAKPKEIDKLEDDADGEIIVLCVFLK